MPVAAAWFIPLVIGAIGGAAATAKVDDTADAVGDAASRLGQAIVIAGVAYGVYRVLK